MLQSTMRRASAVLLLALTTAFTLPSDRLDTLRFNLQEGGEYTLHSTTEQQISQTVMGVEQNIEQTIDFRMRYHVRSITDGTMTLGVRYETYRYDFNMAPYLSMSYDSENEEERANVFFNFMDAMIGKEFTVRMKASGEIVAIEELDTLIDTVIGEVKENAPPQEFQQYEPQMRSAMGVDNVRTSLQMITSHYPEGEVSVGSSWQKQNTIDSEFPLEYKNSYTLAEMADGEARIDLTSAISTDGASVTENGFNSYSLEGTQEGRLTVNTQTGWIVESDMNSEVSGTMSIDTGQGSGPTEVPIIITTHTLIRPY